MVTRVLRICDESANGGGSAICSLHKEININEDLSPALRDSPPTNVHSKACRPIHL